MPGSAGSYLELFAQFILAGAVMFVMVAGPAISAPLAINYFSTRLVRFV